MSYTVLARKYRPQDFESMTGQEHVVRTIENAIKLDRVAHAYLFAGPRGVGKTTAARLLARALNCEKGPTAQPCGECKACLEIRDGNSPDVAEIDGASNNGVENVREIRENAKYMPAGSRFKIYIIDEVHMLSKAAFNALLKTLEEPPEHVKFLLATTDPQKLPVTVLSRCLQFNLKRLDEDQIAGQLTMILGAEGIPADAAAVRALSRAADGSLRDGLSLLDQAIAYAGGKLDEGSVAAMLGSVDRARVGALLSALADGDGAALLREVATLSEFAPDWNDVLDALADALHRVQVRQLVPDAVADDAGAGVDVAGLAVALRPEIVQLWYQMALNARRDLPLAPAPRAGFEMAVLRMLAFRPMQDVAAVPAVPAPAASGSSPAPSSSGSGAGRGSASAAAAARAALAHAPPAAEAARPAPAASAPGSVAPPAAAPAPVQPRAVAPAPAIADTPTPPAHPGRQLDASGWLDIVAAAGLTGPAKQLAAHVAFLGHEGNVLRLALSPDDELLKTPNSTRALAQALAPALGAEPQLRFEAVAAPGAAETLHQRDTRERSARQEAAESAFLADPGVQALMQRHGATLVPDSIRPHDE